MKFKEESDYQILKLTEVFYKNYPNPPYKEILQKTREPMIVCSCKVIMIISSVFRIGAISLIHMPIILKNPFVLRNPIQVLSIPK